MTIAVSSKKPATRSRPVAGAFADELIIEHCHTSAEIGRRPPRIRKRWPRTSNRKSDARVAALMDSNGASESEINDALGDDLCYTDGRYPGRSRLERPDVRVAQIMRLNHASMKEIASALRLSVSTIEKWLTGKQAA